MPHCWKSHATAQLFVDREYKTGFQESGTQYPALEKTMILVSLQKIMGEYYESKIV